MKITTFGIGYVGPSTCTCLADVEQVHRGIGSDSRIGYQFTYPGCDYGGSSSPKDVQALALTVGEVDYLTELFSTVKGVRCQKQILFSKPALDGELERKSIALWALAFNPSTNDRESIQT